VIAEEFTVHRDGAVRSKGRTRRRAEPVAVMRVDAGALALKLADGNAARLQIVSQTEITVRNNSGRKP
jgi:hypothetical protein